MQPTGLAYIWLTVDRYLVSTLYMPAAHLLLLQFFRIVLACTDLFCHRIIEESCTAPHAERQRQALVGYDSMPDSKERDHQKQHLRLHVYASRQTNELRVGENEFQTLVNRLPMASVCNEARAHAIKLLRAQIEFVALFRLVEDQLPDANPVLEQPVFTDMTTVMVTTSRFHPEDGPEERYGTPHEVVDVVARVFGSGVKKIIWSPWCHNAFAMSDFYWPHTPLLGQLPEMLERPQIPQRGFYGC